MKSDPLFRSGMEFFNFILITWFYFIILFILYLNQIPCKTIFKHNKRNKPHDKFFFFRLNKKDGLFLYSTFIWPYKNKDPIPSRSEAQLK